MKVDWIAVARDVLVVLVLGTAGGFAGGVASGGSAFAAQIGAGIAMTVGFCIAGVLSGADRVRHLGLVVVGAWVLGSALSLLTERTTVGLVLWPGLALFLAAFAIGGLLSLLFSPSSPSPPPGS